MNVLDTSSHGDRPMCQIYYANVKAYKLQVEQENMTKAYKIDLEVKGQQPIWIMNVRDTS